MTWISEMFGETLEGGAKAEEALAKKDVIGIYFSAHWCPPCRGFTPVLATSYETITEAGKDFEIVFVSSDRDESQFKDYFKDMPWQALPFSDRAKKAELSKKFKVNGIPSLVLLDGKTGETIQKDGRSIIDADPQGKEFPWPAQTFHELIGDKFVQHQEGSDSPREVGYPKDKTVGIYFSAHWCPPCKAFTPELVKTYNKLKAAGKDFEVIFASSDRDAAAFKSYFGEMPWLAIPHGDPRKEKLSRHFEVGGIPTLVILDKDGNTITTSGRGAVGADPEGAEFPWHPKPLNDVNGDADGLNEETCLIALLDGIEDKAMRDKAVSAMDEVANEFQASAKKAGTDPSPLFFFAKEAGGISDQIRKLTKQEAGGDGDGVGRLVMMDIPDNGGYYVCEKAGIDSTTVRTFLADFHAKKLSRQQLD